MDLVERGICHLSPGGPLQDFVDGVQPHRDESGHPVGPCLEQRALFAEPEDHLCMVGQNTGRVPAYERPKRLSSAS
jgi:hypothetical protein